jgi:hypothetical protein
MHQRIMVGMGAGLMSMWLAGVLAAQPAPGPAARPSGQGQIAAGQGNVPTDAAAEHAPGADAALANRKQTAEQVKAMIGVMREGPPCKLDDLYHIGVSDDGLLKCDGGTFRAPKIMIRVKVEGSDAVWGVAKYDPPVDAFTLCRFEPGEVVADRFFQTNLDLQEGTRIFTRSCSWRVDYWQHHGGVEMTIADIAKAPAVVTTLRGNTLRQLQAEHPELVRQYLVPALRRLGAGDLLRSGVADFYAAFSEIPADPKVTAKLTALLPALDAEDYARRESAGKDLAKLGAAGVLAAMRYDGGKLTSEQQSRLDGLVAAARHRAGLDPAGARKDLPFLVDALGADDPALVKAAHKALEELLGHAVPFDPPADAAKRLVALDALWERLFAEWSGKHAGNARAAEAMGRRDERSSLKVIAHSHESIRSGAKRQRPPDRITTL